MSKPKKNAAARRVARVKVKYAILRFQSARLPRSLDARA